MAHVPSIDLLKQTHKFPGPYVIKVIGDSDSLFRARIIGAVREALHWDRDPEYTERESEGGRHVAITLDLYVDTPEQVRAVYHRLLTVPGIRLLL